jgi:TP901 family phage tail tape measure protein
MPKKALASLNVVINAVTSPLFKGLAIAQKRMVAFGTKMKAIGRSISMSFTLPFAMIGVAGAKMAIDFEKNMTKINTLVGISAKEVNIMGKEVMKLAGETAQAPADLADGLFFLTSAGLKGANAMSTLEQVSKGVAIGLGEQADLAKVAAAAQNAYGEENLSASKALDIFGGMVKTGMFEASDLAGVLGTQLGLAANLNISFEELGAMISTYTKTTGDANAATTGLGGIMMSFAKITPKQEAALESVGMSVDGLREKIGSQGLQATLIEMQEAFATNNVDLSEFFSKSQSLKGVLGVLGNQTETYKGVLEDLHQTTGFVDEGFETVSQTAGFKMQQSFNNLKNAAMELGAMLMPVFSAIADGAVKIAKGFSSLDGGTKKLLVGAAALFAFSGPLMTLAGGLVSTLGMVLTPVGLVVVALGLIFKVIYDNWGTVKTYLVQFVNYFITLYNESAAFRGMIQGLVFTFKTVLAFLIFFGKSVADIFVAIKDTAMQVLGGIGDIIMGIFTFDADKIKEGFNKAMSGVKETIAQAFDGISENAKEFGDKTAENFAAGVEATMNNKPLQLITEEDIQGTVDNVSGWFADKLGAVKDKIQGFMGGTSLLVPEGGSGGGEGGSGGGGGDDGTGALNKSIAKKKSALQEYLDWAKEGYEDLAGKIGEVWGQISKVAGAALSGIGNLFAAEHEKQTAILDNEQIASDERFTKDMERELKGVEMSKMTEEQKEAAVKKIEDKYAQKKMQADEKIDAKRKALELKAAKREKAMKIASAIMGTAQAVVNALAQGGPYAGPILAGVMAGLGAAQIATIASTPLPMASGGIVYGPTNALVGEYPGAQNDPEVVAPLSKLKSMLGNQQQMNVALNVGGVLKGEDIFLANEDTGTNRQRYI